MLQPFYSEYKKLVLLIVSCEYLRYKPWRLSFPSWRKWLKVTSLKTSNHCVSSHKHHQNISSQSIWNEEKSDKWKFRSKRIGKNCLVWRFRYKDPNTCIEPTICDIYLHHQHTFTMHFLHRSRIWHRASIEADIGFQVETNFNG